MFLQRFLDGVVHRVRHAEIIRVDHKQTRIGRIAQALRDGFGRRRALCTQGHGKSQCRKQTYTITLVHASKLQVQSQNRHQDATAGRDCSPDAPHTEAREENYSHAQRCALESKADGVDFFLLSLGTTSGGRRG
jgi:hypothetical protein